MTVIHTEQAPKALGPYSQAIEAPAGRLIFLSGQVPIDPSTGELVPGDIAAQAEQVMKNLQAVLTAAGVGFKHVVRCGIFLVDLGHFAKVNEVYARRFPQHPPARTTVAVAALPKGALIEIDAIAVASPTQVP